MPCLKKNLISNPGQKAVIIQIYNLLFKSYGRQNWWPAKSPFEVIIGAILTQNTNWSNVEKAIKGLRRKGLLSPPALRKAKLGTIASAIRPSGYYNMKAVKLKCFLHFLFSEHKGRVSNMRISDTALLRARLLEVKGIGPETCDSILLYALDKPVFVVDAYTRRLAGCMGLADDTKSYDFISKMFMDNLPRDTRLFNEYHALIVRHAKNTCRKKPICSQCVLRKLKGTAHAS
ncbi:MAG: endonuclease III domain-containing protein [Candidatus Omnitrophica bacterium]|jgi:endonuclease-3 related protein|nr:endonuclease III domain-containing protein [Candidatus Omnitrophota bacterium]